MKPYESYKDSGIQWLGKIPSHWEKIPLKYNLSLKGRIGWNGLKSDEFKEDSYAYLVTGQDFIGAEIDWSKCYQIDKERYEEDPSIQLNNGDLLVTKDGTIGKVAKVTNLDKPACLNSGIFVIKQIRNAFIQDFLYWTFVSNQLLDFNNFNSSGSTIQHLYQNVFENMPLVLPSIKEQESIASYLDYKVSQIDKTIKEEEQMLEDLKTYRSSIISEAVTKGLNPDVPMKDSGIEWIGKIPSHWICVSLKYLLSQSLQYGANESAESINPEWPRYIRITDIDEFGNLRDETYRSLSPEKANEYLLEKGDVLFARSGATVGKTYIFNEEYKACFAGYLIKAKCSQQLLPKFLYYYTNSNSYDNWKNSVFIQATIQNIGADKYSLLPIPVPPVYEQQVIIDYIDEKTVAIDANLSEIQKGIEDLKAYKSSLITEAVTGKIDLRGWNK